MVFASLPNALTILRIILTVPVVIALLNHDFYFALILFFLAGLTDGLDGWIAKRFNLQTRLGSILDPMADKLLLVGSFIALFLIDLIPLWFLSLVFLRDLMIVSGTVGYFMEPSSEKNELLNPSNLSKFNTALQISLVIFLVLNEIYPELNELRMIALISVATSTILSGADYIWIWTKQVFYNEKRK